MRAVIRRSKAAVGRLPLLLAALMGLAACSGPVEPVLEPAEWSFGTVSSDSVLEREIEVGNPGQRRMEVGFLSTCDCLTVEPPQLELPGGASRSIRLRYDPFGDEGEVRMQVIVRAGKGSGMRRKMLPVFGRVLPRGEAVERDVRAAELASGDAGQAPKPATTAPVERPLFSFEYFYNPGCKGCEVFLVRQMIALQQELGIRLRVVKRHIDEPGVQEEYLRLLDALGEEERAYPAVVFDGAVLQGDEEIRREFDELLRRSLEREADEE